VKRNAARFPEDFMFRLTKDEAGAVRVSRSQIVTLKRGKPANSLCLLAFSFVPQSAILLPSSFFLQPFPLLIGKISARLPM
jgi:hypothetical protein